MSLLYSECSRKILIKEAKKWDKKNSLLMNLKKILFNSYKPEKKQEIQQYFDKIKPEIILLKITSKYDKELLKNLQIINKNYGVFNFGWTISYVIKFLKFIGAKCLDITYSNETDLCILNYYKNLTREITKKGIKTINKKQTLTKIEEEKEINKILKDIPDYLILSHTSLNSQAKKNALNWSSSPNKNSFLASTYNIKNTNDIKEYKEIINFNGHKYKLDSCLLSSYYKSKKNGHAIVGINCSGSKYVYNGWDSNEYKQPIVSPCALIPYNWDLRRTDSFCLNPKECKLKLITKDAGLCFSFGKGNRILVYVRIIDNKTSSISDNNKSLSNISSIIKNVYNLNLYTKTELIKQLRLLKYKDIQDKTIEELRLILKTIINKYYKQNSKTKEAPAKKEPSKETKASLIEKIKALKPDIKNLSSKKKEELLVLYLKLKNGTNSKSSIKKEPSKETKASLIEKIKALKPYVKNLSSKKKEELLVLYLKLKNGNKSVSPAKKETKASLIEKIKALKPDIKNLNSKKKEELLEMYMKINH
jgi:hypothetical protein